MLNKTVRTIRGVTIAFVMMFALQCIGIVFGAEPFFVFEVFAGDDVSSHVTSITDISGLSHGTTVDHWDNIGFRVEFSVNQEGVQNVHPGDYIQITWPVYSPQKDALTPHKNYIPLTEDRDGVTVTYANAEVTHDGAKIVFTDAVNDYYNINGFVEIWGKIQKFDNTSSTPDTVTITVGRNTLTYTVNQSPDQIGGDKILDKWGDHTSGQTLGWDLNMNEKAEGDFTGAVTIEDKFGPGHELDGDGSIRLLVFEKKNDGSWRTVKDFYDSLLSAEKSEFDNYMTTQYGSLDSVEDYHIALMYYGDEYSMSDKTHTWKNDNTGYITWSYKAPDGFSTVSDYLGSGSMDAGATSITATIPADKINNKFMILSYSTKLSDDGVLGDYNNTATMSYQTASGPGSENKKWEVKYNDSTGGATGINYNEIQVVKTLDPNGEPLEGIYFKVTKYGDADFVRYLLTNDKGVARLTGLVTGTYYVTEMTEDEAKNEGYNASYPADLLVVTTPITVTIGTSDGTTVGNNISLANKIKSNETVDISGTKVWDDGGAAHDNAAEVKLTLKRTTGASAAEEEVTGVSPTWSGDTYTFAGLDKHDSAGDEYTYFVTEEQVAGYEAPTYSNTGSTDTDKTYDGGTITNKKKEEPPVEKKPLLSVKKISKVNTAAPGSVIPYVITVTNKGDGDANEFVVADIMGDNLTYVSDDSGGTVDGSKIRWHVELAAGAVKTININCRIDEHAQGRIINNVEITGVNGEYIAPDEGEDSAVLGVYEAAEKDNEVKEESAASKSVNTGDEENLMIWLTMIILSIVSIGAIVYSRARE